MTRKKTTTGTMGSKRKTETKAKDKPAEKVATPKRAEHKADEVIPEVAVALLEAHPSLPDRADILEEFAQHFRSAAARAEASAAASAAAEKAASVATEGDRQRGGERKRRTTAEPPSRTVSRPVASFEATVVATPAASAPVAVAAPVFESVMEDEPAAELIATEPEAEVSVFAALEAEASREPEDLFALLAADPTTARASDDDFDFSYQTSSDQSSPFLSAPMPAAALDEGATSMFGAFEDDGLGTPLAMEALPAEEEKPVPATIAPSESTMMTQAMPDDEPAEAEAAGRKSRKSTKKRRG